MNSNCGRDGNCQCNLGIICFGLAIGVTWGLGVFVMGIAGALFGWGDQLIQVLGSAYIGYSASFWGAIIGGIWALVDGFIAGVIIAWLYNMLSRRNCQGQIV